MTQNTGRAQWAHIAGLRNKLGSLHKFVTAKRASFRIQLIRKCPMLTRRLCNSALTLASFSWASGIAAVRPVRATETHLRIGGTGMALAAMRVVGRSFASRHPGIEVEVLPSLGTSGGLSAVTAGAIDLALSARPLNDIERARGLYDAQYARTPIAFVTHLQTVVGGVGLSEIERILKGEVNAWPDGSPIRVVRREPSDADWNLLRRLSPDLELSVQLALKRPGLLTVGTDQENADALQRMRGSFGMVSVGQLKAEDLRLKPLKLDGVAPDVESIASGRYPLSRSLNIAWSGEPRMLLADFVAFLREPEGRAILLRLGHDVPEVRT